MIWYAILNCVKKREACISFTHLEMNKLHDCLTFENSAKNFYVNNGFHNNRITCNRTIRKGSYSVLLEIVTLMRPYLHRVFLNKENNNLNKPHTGTLPSKNMNLPYSIVHTYVLNEFLTADRSCTTKYFWKSAYKSW